MSTISLLIEMEPESSLSAAASVDAEAARDAKMPKAVPEVPGVKMDADFGVTPMPEMPGAAHMATEIDFGHATETEGEGAAVGDTMPPVKMSYLMRADVPEAKAEEAAKALMKKPGVKGVYADVAIQPQLICPGSPPMGTHNDVERLLCTPALHRAGADGSGVLVAIVDSGINMAHLNARGKTPNFDAARSWVPQAGLTPGSLPVGHGTMCAFDVCIAAPKCTLLDIALLQTTASGPTVMAGFLSDAVRAYAHLINVMRAPRRPGESRSLVVNNSWGMFHPSWDFPVGHPGNYSDNPNHPFNRIVATLAGHGADILFAAGNCGSDCPDGRCNGVTSRAIYGANSHRNVTCVAGVDTSKTRVGYSSKGPGRLVRSKPDISGYTHFSGSGVYAADGGTSAACPVVAGVFAAIRTKRPYVSGNASRTPDAIRSLVTSTAQDLGASGYDLEHGYGVVNGCAISTRLRPPLIDICRIRPDLCRPRPVPIDLCRRFPQLCRPIPLPPRVPPQPFPPLPIPPRPGSNLYDESGHDQGGGYGMLDLSADPSALADMAPEDLADLLYYAGWYDASQAGGAAAPGGGAPKAKEGGCGCSG